MVISDPNGKYTISFDEARRLVYETPVGHWKKDDYQRYHNDYLLKIGPRLRGKPWAKMSDLRNYNTSDIADEMSKHIEWMANNNVTHVAIIVVSAIVKMQVNRASKGQIHQQAFTDEKEANEWLKSNGY